MQKSGKSATSFTMAELGDAIAIAELQDRLTYSELRGRLLARRSRTFANSRSWGITIGLRQLNRFLKSAYRVISHIFARAYSFEIGLREEAIKLVYESGLFDEHFYREQLDRHSIITSDCVSHFVMDGWKLGFNPNPFFDCFFYISNARRKDLTIKINPLLHYIILGSKLRLATSKLFDPERYLVNYPDQVDSDIDPLLHFLQIGLVEDHESIPFARGAMSVAGYTPQRTIAALKQPSQNNALLCTEPYDLVLCMHSCSRTGAPSLGLSLLQHLSHLNLKVLIVLLAEGELLPCFEESADTINLAGLIDPAMGLINKLDSLEAARQLNQCVPILVNSAGNHQLIDVFACRGYKVVTLIHEFMSSYSPQIRATLKSARHQMIFSSQAIAQDAGVLGNAFVLSQGLIDESYLYLDKADGKKFLLETLGIAEDAFVVLACGTVELRKGIDTFINVAIDTLPNVDPERDIHFIWVGDELAPGSGPMFWAEVDLRRAGLNAHVHLTGHQTQLQKYFAGADLFLLPSRQDPMPCVLHMAMAATLPAVAFKNNGGAQEVLGHGGGTLVDYGSIHQMTAAIMSYYRDREKLQRDGLRGREVVTSKYKMSQYTDAVLSHCGIANATDIQAERDRAARLHNLEQVEHHYDRYTETYIRCYGDVLQSYRPFDFNQMMHDEMQRMRLTNGMKILDAGCGVCGPAIYFASKLELSFECITISQLQVEIAQGKIAENNMRGKIRVSRGDFHCLPDQFPPDSFDRVLFLEALCHSNDFSRALSAAYAVLKPGGCIYIKDFILINWRHDKIKQAKQKQFAQHSYQEYHYQLHYLTELKYLLRSAGFRILEVTIGPYASSQDLSQQIGFEKAVGFTWRDGEAFDYPVAEGIMILAEKS